MCFSGAFHTWTLHRMRELKLRWVHFKVYNCSRASALSTKGKLVISSLMTQLIYCTLQLKWDILYVWQLNDALHFHDLPLPPNSHTHTLNVFTAGRSLQVACCILVYAYELLLQQRWGQFIQEMKVIHQKSSNQSLNLMKSGKRLFYESHLQLSTVWFNCTFNDFRHTYILDLTLHTLAAAYIHNISSLN